MSNEQKSRSVVDGFKLPSNAATTDNERIWIEFLRIICNERVPPPDSRMVIGLRRFLGEEKHRHPRRMSGEHPTKH